MECISVTEGEPFMVDVPLRDSVRAAGHRLKRELKPRYGGLIEDSGRFTISGIIGTIGLRRGHVLEVRPKVSVGTDWVRAVLDLLVGRERVDAGGERLAGVSARRNDLLEALSAIYAARLERAIRRDGPIMMIERTTGVLPRLKGKLIATEWIRRATWQPHRFPVTYSRLSTDNIFSRTLVWVANSMAGAIRSLHTRTSLRATAQALRPGLPAEIALPTGAAARQLPSQWSAYAPAWSIASSFLMHQSLLGTTGTRFGPSIAIEAWPLLEELLRRALIAATQLGADDGRTLAAPPKSSVPLLVAPSGLARRSHGLEPDGQLVEDGRTVATFEAKYTRREAGSSWPAESHRYQALAAAAVCKSPLAVLIYPDDLPAGAWAVEGFNGHPRWLAAIGLSLYSYASGLGDEERGRQILALVDTAERALPHSAALPIP
jgi:hypothetical protein